MFKFEAMPDYTFPENNWYLKIDDENKDIVNNWRINVIKRYNIDCNYYYIMNDSLGYGSNANSIPDSKVEISTSQFKEYILKEEVIKPIINENIDYLNDLLNKLNIT